MIKKTLTAAAVAAASLLMVVGGSSAAMAAENLVQNGQFDQTQFWKDNGNWYEGEKLGAWDINAHSDGSNPNRATVIVWNPEMEGAGAEMAAPFTYGSWIRVMGSISQSIPTEAGKTYTLTYDSRASGSDANGIAVGWNGGNPSHVLINGTAIDTFDTVTDPQYTTRTVTFTATSDSTLLTLGNAAGGAVGFDRVSVTLVPEDDSPLMVPAIAGGLGMAALAAGGTVLAKRKNKRSEQ